eukprot:IDg6185t1
MTIAGALMKRAWRPGSGGPHGALSRAMAQRRVYCRRPPIGQRRVAIDARRVLSYK